METEYSYMNELKESCSLGGFALFCMELLLLYETAPEVQEEIDRKNKGVAKGIPLSSLYEIYGEPISGQDLEEFLFFCWETDTDGDRYLRLKNSVYGFLMNGTWPHTELEAYKKAWKGKSRSVQAGDEEVSSGLKRLEAARKENRAGDCILIHVCGEEGSGRRETIDAFCRERGREFLLLDTDRLMKESQRLRKSLLEEALLESRVSEQEIGFYCRSSLEEASVLELLEEAAEVFGHRIPLFFLITERPVNISRLMEWKQEYILFQIKTPDAFQAEAQWAACAEEYGSVFDDEIKEILQRYCFTPGRMRQVFQNARNLAWSHGAGEITPDYLAESCRQQVEYQFAGKAKKIESRFSWEDLILPEASLELLRDICDQTRYWRRVYGEWNFQSRIAYGRGNALLFAGSPGTGKTMAAQVMARELHMDLYRVDLSAVVSKYIGETEKNLNLIFNEAGKSLCILFFDEADVLFSKRTEVKDSQDKYNNMEAAFLLQKMEEYNGISILATNLQQNIDEAFKRRLKYTIEFPVPSAGERLSIWKRAFPGEAPLEETVDYHFLAECFELTGSNIKNIAVNAAFAAAAEQSGIGMRQIVKALRSEYKKSGKVLTREDLKQYCMY